MSSFQLIPEGTVLGGDFEIVRLLRHGGMGSVYEAVQRTTGASRAVKVMRGALATDTRFRSRFEQEARVSSRIKSDHVVQVVSAGVDENHHMPWFAMELLDGQDLGEWLERHRRMPWADASGALGQLCHALGAAHSVGVVHRDLKPENIFLSRSRIVGVPFMVKVLDFGVAKVVSEARMATVAVGAQRRPSTMVWRSCGARS